MYAKLPPVLLTTGLFLAGCDDMQTYFELKLDQGATSRRPSEPVVYGRGGNYSFYHYHFEDDESGLTEDEQAEMDAIFAEFDSKVSTEMLLEYCIRVNSTK